MLRGITVTLYEQTQTGVDGFGMPIFTETPVEVDNVLVTPTSSDDMVDELSLYGKKSIYTLAIPKGDTHQWEDKKVSFFGETFKAFSFVTQGIEELIPLDWNKKVKVERYG